MRSSIQTCQTVRSYSVQSWRWSNVADMSQPIYVPFLWETFLIWRLSVQSELLLLPSIVQTHKFQMDMRFIMTEICCATLFIVLCPLLSRASHSSGQDVGRNPTGPTVILLLLEIIYDPLIFFFSLICSYFLLIVMRAVWIFFTVCFTTCQRRFFISSQRADCSCWDRIFASKWVICVPLETKQAVKPKFTKPGRLQMMWIRLPGKCYLRK